MTYTPPATAYPVTDNTILTPRSRDLLIGKHYLPTKGFRGITTTLIVGSGLIRRESQVWSLSAVASPEPALIAFTLTSLLPCPRDGTLWVATTTEYLIPYPNEVTHTRRKRAYLGCSSGAVLTGPGSLNI